MDYIVNNGAIKIILSEELKKSLFDSDKVLKQYTSETLVEKLENYEQNNDNIFLDIIINKNKKENNE